MNTGIYLRLIQGQHDLITAIDFDLVKVARRDAVRP
jgi:hypothetical protein